MPLQNRATPLGDLVAHPGRGLVYGNRGCLHDDKGRIRRRYNGKRWIACRLQFRGWHRERLMQPGRFTELFFLDEASAFAAGHRPCALCRREDYTRFRELWPHPDNDADSIDARLHAERVATETRAQQHHEARIGDLPDGAFVVLDGDAWLHHRGTLLRWTAAGYVERTAAPRAPLPLVTPPSLVAVLRAGWTPVVPFVHPSAEAA